MSNTTIDSIFDANNDYVTCTHLLVNKFGKQDALLHTINYKLDNVFNKQKSQLVEATLQGLHRLCQTK